MDGWVGVGKRSVRLACGGESSSDAANQGFDQQGAEWYLKEQWTVGGSASAR